MAEYKLNYPIVTPEAYAFWESRHKLNRIKAIIAFSLDLDNANDNLRRRGYYRQYRKRYVELYKDLVANPDMTGPQFELSGPDDYWWDPKVPPAAGPVTLGIKTNPVDVTALEGTTATFSVEAKGGTAPYTYQWEYSLMLANWVGVSGGTSQTYSPTAATNTDGLHYRCVIKDAAGATVTSGYGKLTMIPKLAWNAHPTTGTIGTDLDFSWTGGTAPFTVVVLNPAGTEHDRATHTSPYTLNTTGQADGEWTVTVEDSSATKQTVTQKVQMAAVPAPTLRAMHVWMQDNSHNSVNLGPKDPTAAILEYDWDLHGKSSFNYPGVRLRYDDTTYAGATGESAAKMKSSTISDTSVVKYFINNAQSPDAVLTNPSAGGQQFVTLKTGTATITYVYEHVDDPSVEVTGILHITVN